VKTICSSGRDEFDYAVNQFMIGKKIVSIQYKPIVSHNTVLTFTALITYIKVPQTQTAYAPYDDRK
ncbi:MAG: hypothetical protein ACRCRT_05125, partial [Cetobacterium somerae]